MNDDVTFARRVFLQGRLPAMILGFGLFDLFLGVLFLVSYQRTAASALQERRVSA